MARWLATEPKVLLLNDPTRGVDINAKRDLYALLLDLAAEGMAIVMLSTEVDEHVELMDRVLVFREGRIAAELPRERALAPRDRRSLLWLSGSARDTWLFAACLALALLVANVVAEPSFGEPGNWPAAAGGAGAVRDRRDGLDARDPLRRRRPRHLDRADRRARQRRPDRVAARARRRGQRLAGDPDRGPARRRHRRAQRRRWWPSSATSR